MNKHDLSERDICTRFITPALQQAGWSQGQIREEFQLTKGRVVVRGKLASRILNPDAKGGPKRADYVLFAHSNVPLAVIEAKQNKFPLGHGMQQALEYAEMLDVPFAFSSNGDGFLLHDRTGITLPVERAISLSEFPSFDILWQVYQQWKGLSRPEEVDLLAQPYYSDGSGRSPHYYQRVAINRAMEAPHATDFDVFDLVAHIAFDQKPLTRKERAEDVRKRNYFAKYGDQARAVLEALLEKYADHGITDIEDPKFLELPPFTELGTKTQIRRGIFGSSEKSSQALTDLEQALYQRLSA